MKKIFALFLALYAAPAFGQAVQQSGNITPGHGVNWITNGVIGDSGAPSGGVGLLGSFVINDMLCASATGTSISVIDCGFSATGTNNWVGLQNLNGGATAPTRSIGDNTTNVATTAFVQSYNSNLLSTPHTWTALQTFDAGIASTQALSGSATQNALNPFTVTSDTEQCAFCTDISSVWAYGGATARGGRVNIFGWSVQTTPNSGLGQTTVGVGVEGIGQTNSGDGGGSGTEAGTYFGGNFIGACTLFVYECAGSENDIRTDSAYRGYYTIGQSVVNVEAHQATKLDAAFAVYSGGLQAATGGGGPWGPGVGFHYGLAFGELGNSGLVPIDGTGTLIGGHVEALSVIPVAYGFDGNLFSFSSYFLRCCNNSSAFTVDGSGNVTSQSQTLGATSTLAWSTKAVLQSPADGIVELTNNAITGFSRLQLGGTTSSFPAIKRNSTALNFRLADDSADAPITAGAATLSGQLVSTTGLPTIASGGCGATTNGAVIAGSTNQSGNIMIGSATTTTCTLSWSATLAVVPNACVFFPANAAAAATGTTVAYVSSITNAHVILTGSALANANYGYICL